jgi:hypothetical protein
VKHVVLCRIKWHRPRLDLKFYRYLPEAHVAKTSAKRIWACRRGQHHDRYAQLLLGIT